MNESSWRFQDYDDSWGIYQINSQTGAIRNIIPSSEHHEGFLSNHEWGHDGKSIYLVRRLTTDRISQISLREIESGTEKDIYHGSIDDYYLSCSQDGKWLAFMNSQEKVLRIIPAAGGETRELYRCEPENDYVIERQSLRWTHDGKYILFAMEQKPQRKKSLWRISIDDAQPQKLGLDIEKNIFELSVHPDGKHIAFGSSIKMPGEIWMMENFLSE